MPLTPLTPRLAVIRTGVANIASTLAALPRAGVAAEVTTLALRRAVARDGTDAIASTKGVL